ncbi:MAG: transposase [Nitrososphaerota archaeon]|jgi:putative transposase|nr:transposase [Nitrososphaerota archaeon]
MKKYRRDVLSEEQVKWIIKQKGKMKNKDIAEIQGISVRMVQQIYSMYKKSGQVPQLKKPGRHKANITEDERKVIINAYSQIKSCTCYLEHFIMNRYGMKVNHMKIQSVLKQEGFSMENSRPYRKRKWVRYERDHSNSLWHVDWHEIKDIRWKGSWLILYEDDSSRFILGYGVYGTLTSKFSVDVLKNAIKKYGKPEQILSDHGTTFYAIETDEKQKGFTEFEKFLMKEKIAFIVGRVDHPQTNGKVEKFFDIFEKKVKFFNSIDKYMNWYNFIRLTAHLIWKIQRHQQRLIMQDYQRGKC